MRWVRQSFPLLLILFAVVFLFVEYWDQISAWAKVQQREFQNVMGREILELRSGNLGALLNLLIICGAYGVVHAIGPGHGKVLIGAAALTSDRKAAQMAGIGFLSSLFQGVTAIVVTYGILGVLLLTSSTLIGTAENYLVPLSFLAMAAVGAWIVFRGARLISQRILTHHHAPKAEHSSHHDCGHDHKHGHNHGHHHHDDGRCASGCKHMPSVQEVEAIQSWRDVLLIVLSIGVRPCSGALIVLIITWKFGLITAGILSVMAMSLGTGLVVAASGLFASKIRRFSITQAISRDDNTGVMLAGGVNIAAGLFVIAVSSLFFMNDLRAVSYPL